MSEISDRGELSHLQNIRNAQKATSKGKVNAEAPNEASLENIEDILDVKIQKNSDSPRAQLQKELNVSDGDLLRYTRMAMNLPDTGSEQVPAEEGDVSEVIADKIGRDLGVLPNE